MPSVIFKFIKLKIRVAIIGRRVSARKPNIQGARKSKPFRISAFANGDIFRNDPKLGSFGRFLSCSMHSLLFQIIQSGQALGPDPIETNKLLQLTTSGRWQ
jgi:hypothetical protein